MNSKRWFFSQFDLESYGSYITTAEYIGIGAPNLGINLLVLNNCISEFGSPVQLYKGQIIENYMSLHCEGDEVFFAPLKNTPVNLAEAMYIAKNVLEFSGGFSPKNFLPIYLSNN
jgi:hypothetical protein